MAEMITHETQFKIVGADGTTYYTGAWKVMNPVEVFNDEASATILADEAPIFDTTDTIIAASTATAAVTEVVKVIRIVNASSVCLAGVSSFGPILAQKQGTLAGIGSIVPVRTNGTATAGATLITSSTAGQVASGTWAARVVLGACVKANASIGGVNIAGVMVAQA